MAGKKRGPPPPNCFKYGIPLYGVAWPPGGHYFVGGGGGHGLVPRLVWGRYHGGRCTDQVGEYKLGSATPMKMALAPSGGALIVYMTDNSIRRFQVTMHASTPRVIEVTAAFLERISSLRGEVNCLTFSPQGSMLAVGFESGELKLLRYPALKVSMELRLSDGVRDVDFAHLGPHLLMATVCDNGTAQIWDAKRGQVLCTLDLPKGSVGAKAHITRCRFSRAAGGPLLLYVNINQRSDGSSWLAVYAPQQQPQLQPEGRPQTPGEEVLPPPGLCSWSLQRRLKTDSEPNSSFEISRTGHLLALGQTSGRLLVYDTATLKQVAAVQEASMVFVTHLTFSHDNDSCIASVGGDAQLYVLDLSGGETMGKRGGVPRVLLLLLLAVAMAAVAMAVWQPERLAELQQLLGGLLDRLRQHEGVRQLQARVLDMLQRVKDEL